MYRTYIYTIPVSVHQIFRILTLNNLIIIYLITRARSIPFPFFFFICLSITGRTTGSLAWRMARGEIGSSQAPTSAEPFVFKLTEEERKSKVFHVKYSCAKDEYIRVSKNSEVIKPFSSCVNKQQNVFRKEERDWKMAYLARTEGSSSAEISWKFDFSGEANPRILSIFNFLSVQSSLRSRGSPVVFMGHFVSFVFAKMYLTWAY